MTPKKSSPEYKSGFVAITGAPNAGKSTLLNRMLGEKISITSRKPQTTRNRILGVVHRPASQIIFIDTPGVHKASQPLNIRIVNVALSTLTEVDLVLILIDIANPEPEAEQYMISELKKNNPSVVLALNKIDAVKKPEVIKIINKWKDAYPFKAIVPISAKHGDGVETLLVEMEKELSEGPQYYPDDTMTDVPAKFIAAEMIREKVFRLTGQEIPYSVAVSIESFSNKPKKGIIHIQATIHVERDSQKGIIIGKKGSKLKQIGQNARMEIERMLGNKVCLKLFVHVQKNWSKDTKALTRFGY
ncbi:MAG: GTPase Era [Desulfobacterales bacterium]|nr:GTPase Era [Desulfobacterales bacterium]